MWYKHYFWSLFNLPPFQASESPRLLTWLVSSLGLLHVLHTPVLSGEPSNGHKAVFFERDWCVPSPCPHQKWMGSQFAASVAGWWNNTRAKFQWLQRYKRFKHKIQECVMLPFSQIRSHNYIIYVHVSCTKPATLNPPIQLQRQYFWPNFLIIPANISSFAVYRVIKGSLYIML